MKNLQSVSRESFKDSMKQYDVLGYKVDEDIFTTYFVCDYANCRGACCWAKLVGGTEGCPVTSEEAKLIRKHKDELAREIQAGEKRRIAFTNPTYLASGEICVRITKNEECIYSDDRGCIHKRVFGTTPISCKLYPLGIDSNGIHLYHTFDRFCKSSYEFYDRPKQYLIDFLKYAIIGAFGEDFFSELKRIQNDIVTGKK